MGSTTTTYYDEPRLFDVTEEVLERLSLPDSLSLSDSTCRATLRLESASVAFLILKLTHVESVNEIVRYSTALDMEEPHVFANEFRVEVSGIVDQGAWI